MNKLQFHTDTTLFFEAFTIMGLSAKPNSTNPIGQFGTGLKLSVAAILRLGGTFEVFIDGTEYVFYLKDIKFRGTEQQQIMVRKRKGVLSRWSYQTLPFTLNYGRNLDAWQVYRELESNTRDEDGRTEWVGPEDPPPPTGTAMRITCEGLQDVLDEGETFINQKTLGEKVWGNSFFTVYDSPSKYIYYRGVRVYEMKYPSRFTYDFEQGVVELSEDRSPKNVWWMMHVIQHAWMSNKIEKKHIYKALRYDENKDEPIFEAHDLNFDATSEAVSETFREVARNLKKKGFASPKLSTWNTGYTSYMRHVREEKKRFQLKLDNDEINLMIRGLGQLDNGASGDESVAIAKLMQKLKKTRTVTESYDDVPF